MQRYNHPRKVVWGACSECHKSQSFGTIIVANGEELYIECIIRYQHFVNCGYSNTRINYKLRSVIDLKPPVYTCTPQDPVVRSGRIRIRCVLTYDCGAWTLIQVLSLT